MNITKVPCLAVIVGAKIAPENNGKIVWVIERFKGGIFAGRQAHPLPGTISWLVESAGTPLAIKTRTGGVIYSMQRPYNDSCLREIKGDEPEAHDQLLKEKETT